MAASVYLTLRYANFAPDDKVLKVPEQYKVSQSGDNKARKDSLVRVMMEADHSGDATSYFKAKALLNEYNMSAKKVPSEGSASNASRGREGASK